MMKRKSFRILLLASVMQAAMTLTGCSWLDDNPVNNPATIPDIEDVTDIAGGILFHVINADQLDKYKLPLAQLKDAAQVIDISVEGDEYYGVKLEKVGDAFYVAPYQKKEQTETFEAINVKISPKDNPEASRRVLFLFYKPSAVAQTRSTSDSHGLQAEYSSYIGKGTCIGSTFGNVKRSIMYYDRIKNLGESYLTDVPTQGEIWFESTGNSYEKSVEDWAFNVGLSGKNTRSKLFTLGGIPVNGASVNEIFLGTVIRPTSIWSGCINFGMNSHLEASSDYEYHIDMVGVKKQELKLNMDVFEASSPSLETEWKTFIGITDTIFMKEIAKLDTTKTYNGKNWWRKFYDDYGTDIITQGTFGGLMSYIYGRKETVYDSKVGYDASGSMRRAKPCTSTAEGAGDWLKIFQAKNSDYWQIDADAAYCDENYSKVSKEKTFYYVKGGNYGADGNANAWLAGFNDSNTDYKWALISYACSSDPIETIYDEATNTEKIDTVSRLYPMDQFIQNLAIAFIHSQNGVENLSKSDREAVDKFLQISNSLATHREDYLKTYITETKKVETNYVLADIIKVVGVINHAAGTPTPKVMMDFDQKYHIYYPMMANSHAPGDKGYALETAQSLYVDGGGDNNQYFYYALERDDACRGIVDVLFFDVPFSDAHIQRGGCNQDEIDDDVYNGYLYVKPWNDGYSKSKKITAVAFRTTEDDDEYYKKDSNGNYPNFPLHIISSTGGSEWDGYEGSSLTEFNNFWGNFDSKKDEFLKWHSDDEETDAKAYNSDINDKDLYWISSAWSLANHRFFAAYTNKKLSPERVKNIRHPKKWGE